MGQKLPTGDLEMKLYLLSTEAKIHAIRRYLIETCPDVIHAQGNAVISRAKRDVAAEFQVLAYGADFEQMRRVRFEDSFFKTVTI